MPSLSNSHIPMPLGGTVSLLTPPPWDTDTRGLLTLLYSHLYTAASIYLSLSLNLFPFIYFWHPFQNVYNPSWSSKNSNIHCPISILSPSRVSIFTFSIFLYFCLQCPRCPASPPTWWYSVISTSYLVCHPHYPASPPPLLSSSIVSVAFLIKLSSVVLCPSQLFVSILLCLCSVFTAFI